MLTHADTGQCLSYGRAPQAGEQAELADKNLQQTDGELESQEQLEKGL